MKTPMQSALDHSALQLAMYQNRIDHIESGTVKWEDLDLTTRADYLAEAKRSIGALLALGWRPQSGGANLIVPPADLKALREALCRAQSGRLTPEDSDRLSEIITEIDRNRPLGPDGKHGDRHTATCGCEDR